MLDVSHRHVIIIVNIREAVKPGPDIINNLVRNRGIPMILKGFNKCLNPGLIIRCMWPPIMYRGTQQVLNGNFGAEGLHGRAPVRMREQVQLQIIRQPG